MQHQKETRTDSEQREGGMVGTVRPASVPLSLVGVLLLEATLGDKLPSVLAWLSRTRIGECFYQGPTGHAGQGRLGCHSLVPFGLKEAHGGVSGCPMGLRCETWARRMPPTPCAVPAPHKMWSFLLGKSPNSCVA